MTVDFSPDAAFEEKLAWAREFVVNEVEPLDLLFPGLHYAPPTPEIAKIVNPLKEQVRAQGLWAYALPPELGGCGGSAVRLAQLNEHVGRAWWGPVIFGSQAPDTGNAEILAKFGTEEQKGKYLQPLLNGELFSCFSMTEPQGGADPGVFTTRAVRDGADWIINGTKFFSSNARWASFYIVMAVTDPDKPIYEGMSMFLVDKGTPGVEIIKNFGLAGDPVGEGSHALIRYENVRVPADALLGEEGNAFAVAQVRLGGGRLHHAMRAVGLAQRAFEMTCERALSRVTKGSPLSEKQIVQMYVAESWQLVHQLRLQVLHAAWTVDNGTEREAREAIAAVKVAAPRTLREVVTSAIQVHGALGVSNQLPLWEWLHQAYNISLADGPVEVHQLNLAKSVLRAHRGTDSDWPSELIDDRLATARDRYAGLLP
ncbi:acyl-CoA dehydrogenase family protein [Streptomyces sp. NPDC001156]